MKKKPAAGIKSTPSAPPAQQEAGAPAALKAIEIHELKCREEKDAAHAEWKDAQRLEVEGDDVSEAKERRMHYRYVEALEHWDDATKKLAVFDKGVTKERREGEKIAVEEAKEIFAQLILSYDLAFEKCLLTDARDAALAKTEVEFHSAHSQNWRAAKDGAIESAKGEGVIPKWIL